MLKRFCEFALVATAGFASVRPAFAQSTVSRIDAEHSSARLYLASSTDPGSNLNVGVGRASGVVKLNAGDSASPDFDFAIYPADEKSPSPGANRRVKPDYTVIAFKSRHVVRLAANTYRVSGNLTLTYVQRTVSDDPPEGSSGPTYGPSITISQTHPASFEFRRVVPSGGTPGAEWIASSNISVEDFPELMTAVSSGPASTGERIGVAARKDLNCGTPPAAGEDFSGEVSAHAAPSIIAPDQHHHDKADANHIVANEVQIQLDLFTTGPGSAITAASGQ